MHMQKSVSFISSPPLSVLVTLVADNVHILLCPELNIQQLLAVSLLHCSQLSTQLEYLLLFRGQLLVLPSTQSLQT